MISCFEEVGTSERCFVARKVPTRQRASTHYHRCSAIHHHPI